MRRWIRFTLPLGLAAIFFLSVLARGQPGPMRAVSVQMHVHASMSEGPGSWRAANVHAKKIGLDVLWWSDHDWRMAYHTYNRAFGFEGPGLSTTVSTYYEPGTDVNAAAGNDERMTITLTPHKLNGNVKDGIGRTTTERATEGTRSFEVGAAAAAEGWQPYLYEIDATRRTMKRSLASNVKLSFAVFADAGDHAAAVRVDLSQQPPDMKAGAIYYVLTQAADADLKPLEDAHTKVVRLPFQPGSWNRVNVDVTRDADRLQLGGIDNAMVAVSFGVLTRGSLARAFFDDYVIQHELQGEALRDVARAMAARYQKEYGVINYVGQELSFQAHMNPLGERVPMIDHVRHPAGLNARETSDFVHANGGILSLNHIFGTNAPPPAVNTKDPDSVRAFEDRRIRELTENRVYGADILEVGYPTRVLPMTSFLRVWDALSGAGIDVVGNGISDTHGSVAGWYDGNNFISWVWTRSASMADIVDGFRRGDVYFGDPVQFKGTLTLTTSDGHRMGSVVVTKKPEHLVSVKIEGLPPGARVRTVVNGQAGAEETPARSMFENRVRVDTSAPAFVRVEAYSAEGRPLVFSNPIYFRADDDGTISASKRAICR